MDIKNTILEVLKGKLNKDFTKDDYNKKLVEELGLDSLDTVELVMELEEKFDIQISDEDAKSLQTINHILDYVEQKMANKA